MVLALPAAVGGNRKLQEALECTSVGNWVADDIEDECGAAWDSDGTVADSDNTIPKIDKFELLVQSTTYAEFYAEAMDNGKDPSGKLVVLLRTCRMNFPQPRKFRRWTTSRNDRP